MNIWITGHALSSVHGDSFEEYQAADGQGIHIIDRNFKALPKVRRTDRLSRICLYTTMQLLEKHAALKDLLEETGIVLSSKYGPHKVCKEYIEQVRDEGYDLGSPTLFSATVPNAGIGYICRALQLHGPMISERGSDGIISAVHLLRSGKAKVAYSIAVDEITEALTVLTDKQVPEYFSEICNVITLESEEQAMRRNAPALGLLHAVETYAVRKETHQAFSKPHLFECLEHVLDEWDFQFGLLRHGVAAVLLSSRTNTEQGHLEQEWFTEHLQQKALMLSPKDFYGESFASSFQNAILYGLLSDHIESPGYVVALDADFEESKLSLALLSREAIQEGYAC